MAFKLLLSYTLLLEYSRGSQCFSALSVALAMAITLTRQVLTLLVPSILQTSELPTFG